MPIPAMDKEVQQQQHYNRVAKAKNQATHVTLPPYFTDPLKVLYNGPEMAVIVKPQGLPVQGPTSEQNAYLGEMGEALCLLNCDLTFPVSYPSVQTTRKGLTHLPFTHPPKEDTTTTTQKPKDAMVKATPVHRIDACTGGIMLLGKTKSAMSKYSQLFSPSSKSDENESVIKIYRAIVLGNFLSASSAAALGDEVTVTLLEDDDRWQGCIDSPISKKRSLTKFKVIETKPWLEGELSLVEFQIMTGRKHQIRRHCQKLGCPILGDLRYGPYTKREKNDNAVEVEVFGSTATYGAGWNFYFKESLHPVDYGEAVDRMEMAAKINPHQNTCLWSHSLTIATIDSGLETFTSETPSYWQALLDDPKLDLLCRVVK